MHGNMSLKKIVYLRWFFGVTAPIGPGTSLDKRSARRWALYLKTHSTYNRPTSMPPVEFEPTTSAGERPQTYALDRAATGTGFLLP